MARLPAALGRESADRPADQAPDDDAPPGLRSALRKALLGLGVLVLAYLVARKLGSGGETPAANPGRESGPAGRSGGGRETATGSPAGSEPGEELPGVDRSTGEIAERAESDVQETPAEPGEMTVDEEVAEEVIDEAEDERSDEQPGEDGDRDRDRDRE